MDQSLSNQSDISTKNGLLYGTGCLFELTKWIVVSLVGLLLIHFFIATIFIVDGVSMEPNFKSGELVIANRWQYLFGTPTRGDAVILKFPGDPERKKYIKRIIGLPNERLEIQNNEILVNGQKLVEPYIPSYMFTEVKKPINVTLGSDEYFLMGDNRPNSNDSRIWGTAARRFLIGRAWFGLWPKPKSFPEIKF